MLSVAVLIISSGRGGHLLQSMETFIRQADDLRAEGKCSFELYVLDVGAAMRDVMSERFPEVRTVRGVKDEGWSSRMRTLWTEAADARQYDAFLWYDSNSILSDGALSRFMETSALLRNKATVAGSVAGPDGGIVSGGLTYRCRRVIPDTAIPVPCDSFDGGFVLIPAPVFKAVGNIDEIFHDGGGAFDYGIRARKAGFLRVVAPGILATRSEPSDIQELEPKERFVCDRRARGLLYAVLHPLVLRIRRPWRR